MSEVKPPPPPYVFVECAGMASPFTVMVLFIVNNFLDVMFIDKYSTAKITYCKE